jgi:hypothetical protein
MILLAKRLAAGLAAFSLFPLCPGAASESEIWNARITQAWLDDHVQVARPRTSGFSGLSPRAQVWSSGIVRSDMQVFATSPSDRTVGAKLQPVRDFDFLIGTELTRGGDVTRWLSSRVNWEAFWARDLKKSSGLELALSTAGSVDMLQSGYSQSVSGTVGIPLRASIDMWSTQLRLSPAVSLDASSGAVGSSLTSEIVSRKVLSSHNDAFRSVLNVKLGYGVSPHARPVASALLELRISPNL